MIGGDPTKTRAEKIRARATSAAQDPTHLSRHFAMLEKELGNRTSGDLLYANDIVPRRTYAGILFLMLVAFSGTLAFFAYQNGQFDNWLGDGGAVVQRPKAWIKANDYKIVYVPVPAKAAADGASDSAGSDENAASGTTYDTPALSAPQSQTPGEQP